MTTIASTAVVVYDPGQLDPEHVALAGFLGGYRGLTRDAYALDLRQFVAFCQSRELGLFEVRRSDIETFGRQLEGRGRATATIARRLAVHVSAVPEGDDHDEQHVVVDRVDDPVVTDSDPVSGSAG